jgi:hypothetical protein
MQETGNSIQARAGDEWEPDWLEERFILLLKCLGTNCGEVISVSGTTKHEVSQQEDEFSSNGWDYVDRITMFPRFVDPAPAMFDVPLQCPQEVSDHIACAWLLYWVDHQACANRLRSALESLLDHLGIARSTINKHRKRQSLSLHSRVERLSKRHPVAANMLMAAKWIGNVGTHGNQITDSDLFDQMDLLEHALELLVAKRPQKLRLLAAKIKKAKGPLRRESRSRH